MRYASSSAVGGAVADADERVMVGLEPAAVAVRMTTRRSPLPIEAAAYCLLLWQLKRAAPCLMAALMIMVRL